MLAKPRIFDRGDRLLLFKIWPYAVSSLLISHQLFSSRVPFDIHPYSLFFSGLMKRYLYVFLSFFTGGAFSPFFTVPNVLVPPVLFPSLSFSTFDRWPGDYSIVFSQAGE